MLPAERAVAIIKDRCRASLLSAATTITGLQSDKRRNRTRRRICMMQSRKETSLQIEGQTTGSADC